MLADGRSHAEIQDRLQTTAPTISRWKARYKKDRIEGLTLIRRPRKETYAHHAKAASQSAGSDTPETKGWLHLLVLPQAGQTSSNQ
jgi:transposase